MHATTDLKEFRFIILYYKYRHYDKYLPSKAFDFNFSLILIEASLILARQHQKRSSTVVKSIFN